MNVQHQADRTIEDLQATEDLQAGVIRAIFISRGRGELKKMGTEQAEPTPLSELVAASSAE